MPIRPNLYKFPKEAHPLFDVMMAHIGKDMLRHSFMDIVFLAYLTGFRHCLDCIPDAPENYIGDYQI